MPSHVSITDPNIHEPKGVSSATVGRVYVSDGAGSGSWRQWPLGKAYYQNGPVGQTITTTPSKLAINGVGTLTRTDKLPLEIRGSGQLWNTATYRIMPIRLNDGYLVRIDVPITAMGGSPNNFRIQMDIGAGTTPTPVIFDLFTALNKTPPFVASFTTAFDVLTTDVLNNGIELFCSVDVGTVTLGAPGIYIAKVTDGNW